ncbi:MULTISPECIES: hypothetical protein [Bacillus cereus group]|uniref:hypothetical protein n=1 Tax=Bacillus cereus group TaxID=86661 RepID=UPI001F195148|nr:MULTISPECIES: hypothetical protein [Bacillus cereus group]MED2903008.1 hypothetical protein [Bacillus tropicus]
MTLRSYEVTLKNGKSEVVNGKVFLFSENNAVVPIATNLNMYNANLVQSIKEVKQESCAEEHEGKAVTDKFPDEYRGMKISETALNIRRVIIENRINCLKDIEPEHMELLLQLFKNESPP